jgi:alpha-L-fucosidase 2
MNCRARLGEGEKAYEVYQRFIRERTVPNLWTLHPPFQIDGSLGTMAGVAEMLLQSHGDAILILPALPKAWNDGHFNGLVARGNFVVTAKWKGGTATELSILSRSGGECKLAYPSLGAATVKDSRGNAIKVTGDGKDRVSFATAVGEIYTVELKNK